MEQIAANGLFEHSKAGRRHYKLPTASRNIVEAAPGDPVLYHFRFIFGLFNRQDENAFSSNFGVSITQTDGFAERRIKRRA